MAIKIKYHIETLRQYDWETKLAYPCSIKSKRTIYWTNTVEVSDSFDSEQKAIEAIEKYLPDGNYQVVKRIAKTEK